MLGLLGIDWGYGFDQTPGATGISGFSVPFCPGSAILNRLK
jgi:hypothetical protein